MTDFMSKQSRSQVMSRIRGKDTTPERYMAVLLKAAGIEFLRHQRNISGCPDFVIPKYKLLIFIDGDFWHGWRFPVWRHRLNLYWRNKIADNRARDTRNHRILRNRGWRVLRVWEHQIEKDIIDQVRRIIVLCGHKDTKWDKVYNHLKNMPVLKYRNRLPRA